jgi:phosphoglycolate phosphatase
MKYKLVIFDFDGTLAATFPWFMSVINSLADKHGFKHIEDHEVEMLRCCHARKAMKHLGVSMWRLPMIGRDLRRRMARDIQKVPLYAGVPAMLKHLSDQGVILALVTSNTKDNVLKVLGLENTAYIKYMECGVSMFGKRPKLRMLIKKARVRPCEAICIGDEVRDIDAAVKEHIAFGGVPWGYTSIEALRAHAHIDVFSSMEEIAEKLG